MTLRRRILLLFLPAVVLPLLIAVAGVWLLDNLGRRSEEIIRDNYVSLRAMADLNAHLLDADRLVLTAIVQGEKLHPTVPEAFRTTMDRARDECRTELGNVTVPGEREAAEQLTAAVADVARAGEAVFTAPPNERWARNSDPETGFQPAATRAWRHLTTIRAMNEAAMYEADAAARRTARRSAVGLAAGTAATLFAAAFFGWRMGRAVLGPVRAVTDAAAAIGGGELHHVVPVQSRDEIGRLAEAFNSMAAKLRAYRQTDTERLLRARQTGQATIDSFPDPVVVIDTDGGVESANPAAQRVLGVRPPRDGEPRAAWTPPESLRRFLADARRQEAVRTESFDGAVTFRLDGDDRVYLPQVRPIRTPEGEPLGAAVVLSDVTRFRLLDRLKSDWVATVSHELKTPLTSVRLAVHVLLEELVGPLEPKQLELLVEARENTERLFKLIEQLLALAKLEDGRDPPALAPADPAALLRAAADGAAARAEDKRIELTVDAAADLPPVAADADRLGRALNNLLDNALAYTEAGGRVTLSAARAGEGVRLTVADNGIGIPPEHLPHVFDRFFRVPGRDGTPGTGLGLAIVREVVTAHGGEITCDSRPGEGTTFHITLPAAGGHA